MVAFSAFNVTYDIWLVMMTEQVLKKNSKNTIQSLIGIEGGKTSQLLLLLLVR